MSVVALCLAPARAQPVVVVEQIEIVAGAGIVGDQYFGVRDKRQAGRNVTLISMEEIEAFNARTGATLAPTDPRRNIVTRNVRLNDLVGTTFAIGAAILRGVELCEPCGKLARYLAGPAMSRKEFIHELTHRCGLRADAVGSGTVRLGDAIVPSR